MEIDSVGYEYEIGARRRRKGKRGSVTQNIPNRSALILPPQPRAFASAIPGVPTPGRRVRTMGLTSATFNASSGLRLQLQRQCQKPFSPTRLFLEVARTGTSATGLVTVDSIKIGSDEQLISGGVPASMFFGAVFDVDIEFDEAAAGLLITIDLIISAAPTTTDTVVVAGGIHGVTMS